MKLGDMHALSMIGAYCMTDPPLKEASSIYTDRS